MSDHAKQSLPHLRTRHDHSTELAEDYVEAIAEIAAARGSCRVVDLAKHFGVSHVTVNRTIGRLQNEGLVTTEPYKPVSLTRKGLRLAVQCRKRHEIVYQFLLAIGVDPQTAAIDAEGIEHHVSPATLQCFVNWSKTKDSIS
ncbi:MAG: manganese-binding transcriptional regulator MntR [Rubripirellula sp.]|nr:manganese-binding transcriptional regulator MntR [Rubripirellula sp.]